MQLEGIATPMSISKKYVFDCSKLPINVHFVEEASRLADAATADDALGGFFHELDFTLQAEVPEPEPELQAEAAPGSTATADGSGGGPVVAPNCSSTVLRAAFCHLCEPDTYEGSMQLDLERHSFTWAWKVTGPHKDGEIVSTFTRATG